MAEQGEDKEKGETKREKLERSSIRLGVMFR